MLITEARAERLVHAITVLAECEDCPADLRQMLEDARRALAGWSG